MLKTIVNKKINNKILNNKTMATKIINNKKSMKKEFIFPLIIGLVAGALIMIFWQFNTRLSNANMALAQLEQATNQNTKTINEVVAFIQQATGANKQTANPTETPSPAK